MRVPVGQGVGLGEHGAPFEEPFDLLTELARRSVAALWFVAQGRQDNPVEVAADPSDERAPVSDVRPLRRGTQFVHALAGRACAGKSAHGLAWRRDGRRHCVVERRRRAGRRDRPRPDARQQFVQDDAECIHIGRGRRGAVLPLFRRTVFRRDEAHLGARGRRLDVPGSRVEELRDAEIEQLHVAGSRHEDIRRLEVAMDHQGAMRVLHGIAHHAKQPQPCVERQAFGGAPFRDRDAIDELHDEIRCSVRRKPAVDETSDVGMDQVCEHLSLGAKALDGVRVARARAHEFDRHFLPILTISALGAVHRAHTATSEDADEAPRPERAAEQRIGGLRVRFPIDDESFDGEGAIDAGGGEHRFELVHATRHPGRTPPRGTLAALPRAGRARARRAPRSAAIACGP